MHSSSAALLHALIVVTRTSWAVPSTKTVDHAIYCFLKDAKTDSPPPADHGGVDSVCRGILDKLFSLVQDPGVDPFFRGLAVQWLISLSSRSCLRGLLLERYCELSPRWQDPLELQELKLQFILHVLVQKKRLQNYVASRVERDHGGGGGVHHGGGVRNHCLTHPLVYSSWGVNNVMIVGRGEGVTREDGAM